MYKASFHKSQRNKELIESAKCRGIFLPPYLPELNPTEKFLKNMKRWIKKKTYRFNKIYDALFALFNSQFST